MFGFDKDCVKRCGLFLGGVLFGTVGIKILSSRDAKNCYVQATAAALRAKECVLDTAACVQENAEDILAEAKQVNEDRAAEDAAKVFDDADEFAYESGESEPAEDAAAQDEAGKNG